MSTNPIKEALDKSQPFQPTDGVTPPLKIHRASDFLKAPPEPRAFLLEDTLPLGEVGLLAGASGIGKSMLTMEIGRAVKSGSSVCGGLYHVSTPGNVLIINAEDDSAELGRRYWSLHHATVSQSNVIELPTESNVSKPEPGPGELHFCSLKGRTAGLMDEQGELSETFNQVKAAISQIGELRLIIFDPMRRLFHGNEDSSDTAARFIHVMDELAADTGATILLVHHLSKASASKGSLDQYAAKGSGAFTDLVRWQLNIAPPKSLDGTGLPKDHRHEYLEISVSKNNYGPPQVKRLFLHRCDGGVLKYVHSSGHQGKLDSDVEIVVGVIKAEFEMGRIYSKTDLRKLGASLEISLGQKAVSGAIDLGIESGLLELVKRPNHKAKGKRPMDVLPAGCVHPEKQSI